MTHYYKIDIFGRCYPTGVYPNLKQHELWVLHWFEKAGLIHYIKDKDDILFFELNAYWNVAKDKLLQRKRTLNFEPIENSLYKFKLIPKLKKYRTEYIVTIDIETL